ncbi:glycine betaine ABC transporter substrate-binding protein [Lacticaseibacillus thailandensis]|uniref:glycine betaine ABC transporter substrate-binding protein n=1 Tax=Lacticaseibacillus thailandensis TaxID=381741 RepID=UPI000704B2FF|nr:glycine betaine ABC transporter substrate-binding protein [Lacticaseibacillus thailandensis]
MKQRQWWWLLVAAVVLLVPTLAGCSTDLAQYQANKAVGPQVDYTITGIDAGAGEMATAQKAIKKYHLSKWQLQTSSSSAMTSTLGKAIKNRQAIIVTGWQPHWMFTKYKLKFLRDPKGVFGKAENIHTVVRKGLKQDKPEAYTVLNRFHWTKAEMSKVMLAVNKGADPKRSADKWIKQHPQQVRQWTAGVKHVHGQSLKMTYVAWDSEVASTNVVAEVLRSIGYKVTIQSMEMQPMWASIATKAADAQVCAWLPNTSGVYYRKYRGQFVDLGVNLRGAKVGLAVPTYMTKVNSITDLNKK